MREIQLTKGYVALVDDEDYGRLAQHNWQAHVKGRRVYAVRQRPRLTQDGPGHRQIMVMMHREITEALPGEKIIHRFGIGLDNQSRNLHRGTNQESIAHQSGPQKHNGSGIKGVVIKKGKRGVKFRVRITHNYKVMHVATCDDPETAAAKYLEKARELFGEFARA